MGTSVQTYRLRSPIPKWDLLDWRIVLFRATSCTMQRSFNNTHYLFPSKSPNAKQHYILSITRAECPKPPEQQCYVNLSSYCTKSGSRDTDKLDNWVTVL